MRFIKRLTRSDGFRNAACWLGAQYIRLVHTTTRWEVRGAEGPRALWDAGRPFILGFWHGRLLLMPYCWDRTKPIRMLVSAHADGQLIARTVTHFGIGAIAGSSAGADQTKNKGGARAYREILRTLKSGGYVGITPDGPRGPRMRVAGAIVEAARRSNAPVLACTVAVRRRRLLSSWDRFMLALPFTRGVFLWSEPIEIPRDQDAETARRRLEDRMNELTAEADRLCGHSPVEAGPVLNGPAADAAPAGR